MKAKIYGILITGGILFVLPLLLSVFLSGKEILTIKRQWNMESVLPILMCREIPWEYEDETKKVQAVLTRSSLYLRIKDQSITKQEWEKLWKEWKTMQQKENYQQAYQTMEKAVKETKGELLFYDNNICNGVFHRLSGGATRDGLEVFGEMEKGYLLSVDSNWDMFGDGYLSGHYFSEKALKILLTEAYSGITFTDEPVEEQIVVNKTDEAGYVLELNVGGQKMSGEEFRGILKLPSSNFTMQSGEGKIRFLCKGQGHGLGFSQYGGNVLAKEGKSYKEILRYYFPECTVKKNA